MSGRVAQANKEARECLTTALVHLAKEKPFSKITVTELCAKAGVSRMTFYRNYSSKQEILSSRVEELVEGYRHITSSLLQAGEMWYGLGHLTTYFEYLKKHREFINCLLESGFSSMFVGAITDFIISCWGYGSRGMEYVLTGWAASLCASYTKWAKDGFRESPITMAELISMPYQLREQIAK